MGLTCDLASRFARSFSGGLHLAHLPCCGSCCCESVSTIAGELGQLGSMQWYAGGNLHEPVVRNFASQPLNVAIIKIKSHQLSVK